MSTTPTTAILETILLRLTVLFLDGTAGDPIAARQAAWHMLKAYHPETEDEFCLAANCIAYGFQALEALSQAAVPDTPLTHVLRLRGSAVSLGREAEKTRRLLTKQQQARQQGTQPDPSSEPAAKIEKAVNLVRDTAQIAASAKASGQTWTRAYESRQRERRVQQRAEAQLAAQAGAAMQTPHTQAMAPAM